MGEPPTKALWPGKVFASTSPRREASTYLVKKGDDWLPVTAFSWAAGKAVAVTAKDEIPSNEWSGLVMLPAS